MIKKVILAISIVINIVLAVILAVNIRGAADKLKFVYVDQDTLDPSSLRMYLDMENYGTAASISRPIRGGAKIEEVDKDYYLLGEYADVLFLKELFEETGNAATIDACDKRLKEIVEELPEYSAIFEKIRWSVDQALGE